jgi:hypothetical protein
VRSFTFVEDSNFEWAVLQRDQDKRGHPKILEGGYFLRKSHLAGLAPGYIYFSSILSTPGASQVNKFFTYGGGGFYGCSK